MTSESPNTPPTPARTDELRRVIGDVLARRQAGETLPDQGVMDAHPSLMPELASELARLRLIHSAKLAADQLAGSDSADGAGPGPDDFFDVLTTHPDIPGYQVLRTLAQGGQAVVFEAVQNSTGRKVAIKVIRDGHLASPRERTRFDREAQILAAIQHPSIVGIIDRGMTPQGLSYFVMELILGQPLDTYLHLYAQGQGQAAPTAPPAPPLDPAAALHLFLKVCDAVNAAHLRGVVHRDLKPSNILIDGVAQPRILDFGLARVLGPVSTGPDKAPTVSITGQFIGSLPWASPEQAEGDPAKIDIRTDVYALGVILYQILTDGKFPYEVVGTMHDVLHNILTAAPTPPSQLLAAAQAQQVQSKRRYRRKHPAAINPTIEAIVLKALAKQREARYQSAGELASDIGNYLAGRPTIAAGLPPHPARWPWAIAAAVAVIVLAAAAAGGTWWVLTHAQPGIPRGDGTAAAGGAAAAGGNTSGAVPSRGLAADASTAGRAADGAMASGASMPGGTTSKGPSSGGTTPGSGLAGHAVGIAATEPSTLVMGGSASPGTQPAPSASSQPAALPTTQATALLSGGLAMAPALGEMRAPPPTSNPTAPPPATTMPGQMFNPVDDRAYNFPTPVDDSKPSKSIPPGSGVTPSTPAVPSAPRVVPAPPLRLIDFTVLPQDWRPPVAIDVAGGRVYVGGGSKDPYAPVARLGAYYAASRQVQDLSRQLQSGIDHMPYGPICAMAFMPGIPVAPGVSDTPGTSDVPGTPGAMPAWTTPPRLLIAANDSAGAKPQFGMLTLNDRAPEFRDLTAALRATVHVSWRLSALGINGRDVLIGGASVETALVLASPQPMVNQPFKFKLLAGYFPPSLSTLGIAGNGTAFLIDGVAAPASAGNPTPAMGWVEPDSKFTDLTFNLPGDLDNIVTSATSGRHLMMLGTAKRTRAPMVLCFDLGTTPIRHTDLSAALGGADLHITCLGDSGQGFLLGGHRGARPYVAVYHPGRGNVTVLAPSFPPQAVEVTALGGTGNDIVIAGRTATGQGFVAMMAP